MVLKPEPILEAVESIKSDISSKEEAGTLPIILLTPQGRSFTQAVVQELAQHEHIALICGRYEGVDERVRQHLVTDEISLGDFVMTGGELAALAVIDAVTRTLPGALGDPNATQKDSWVRGRSCFTVIRSRTRHG